MDQKAEHALQFFRGKVAEFNRKMYVENDVSAHINLYDVLMELQKQDADAVATVIDLLNDDSTSDMHHWMLMALRGVAQRGAISYETAKQILKSTERTALGDGEEWFKSIQELARSPQGIRVLLEFMDRLLDKHDVYSWRWLAFFTVGTILYRDAASVPESLKEKLKAQIYQEPDPHDRKYMQEVADIF